MTYDFRLLSNNASRLTFLCWLYPVVTEKTEDFHTKRDELKEDYTKVTLTYIMRCTGIYLVIIGLEKWDRIRDGLYNRTRMTWRWTMTY